MNIGGNRVSFGTNSEFHAFVQELVDMFGLLNALHVVFELVLLVDRIVSVSIRITSRVKT